MYKILIPYFIYMLFMGILTGNTVDEWNEINEQRLIHSADKTLINLDYRVTLRAIIFTGVSMIIMMFFAALEIT